MFYVFSRFQGFQVSASKSQVFKPLSGDVAIKIHESLIFFTYIILQMLPNHPETLFHSNFDLISFFLKGSIPLTKYASHMLKKQRKPKIFAFLTTSSLCPRGTFRYGKSSHHSDNSRLSTSSKILQPTSPKGTLFDNCKSYRGWCL